MADKDKPVFFLRGDTKIVNPDGTPTQPFLNAWNNLTERTGGEFNNAIRGVINGAAQAQADADAARAAAAGAASAAGTAQVTADGAQSNVNALAGAIDPAALPFYASVDPSFAVSGRAGAGSATTNSVTVTPTGGTGPYTYAWTLEDGASVAADSPTSATTTFTGSVTLGGANEGLFKCTVTDSLLATAEVFVGTFISEETYVP